MGYNKQANRRYYLANKEKILKRSIEWNRLHSKDYQRGYQCQPHVRAKRNEYIERRIKEDPAFKIIRRLRTRQRDVLKGQTSTTQGLGCDKNFLRKHVESLWLKEMSWDNYGSGEQKWVIDHVLPLSSYEKDPTGEWDTNSEYNKQLIHYTNLQPLWFLDNAVKGSRI